MNEQGNTEHLHYAAPEEIALNGSGLRCLWDARFRPATGLPLLSREHVERDIRPMLRAAYERMRREREARG